MQPFLRLDTALLPALLAATLGLQCARAQSPEEEDLAQAYGDQTTVSIATGSQQPLRRAPAVATVITAEDIKAIGATDLDEALETVPGLHVSRSAVAYSPIYTIRGVRGTLTNPQVLMLVNGVPITSVYNGDRGLEWGGYPVDNIARIEVIRGPGSALYGADAFAGVINIVTKTAATINGTHLGSRAGSFKTGDVWMLHGGQWGAMNVAGYLRAGETRGDRSIISADAQTGWDAVYGSSASHAPGPVDNRRRAIDGSLDLSQNKWQLRTAYQKRNTGSGAGVAQALDPQGHNFSERFSSDLTWHDPEFSKHWDVTLQTSYLYYNEVSYVVLFPPGAFGGLFPNGMIGAPEKWERHLRLNASAFYTGIDNHRIRLGIGQEKEDLYKTRERKNFTLSPALTAFSSLVEASDAIIYMRPHRRIVRHFYVQDEWNFAKDWTLTTGVRQDRYSDFGKTTNPRLALIWEAAYNLTAKLLYGSAFRAPGFQELYSINNPVVQGSPGLKPERMKTLEAALSWQAQPQLHLGANIFSYRMNDIIRLSGTHWQNTGAQSGKGLELEATWNASASLRLSGNYAYQRSIDQSSGQDAGQAPRHHAYLRSDWRFTPGWLVNLQLNFIGERKREPGDTRPAVPRYTTVDTTLRSQIHPDWECVFSVRNLFNTDAREPSQYTITSSQSFNAIPNDLPLPRRSVFLELNYKL